MGLVEKLNAFKKSASYAISDGLLINLGKENSIIPGLIYDGEQAKIEKPNSNLWADYYFIAACYASKLDNYRNRYERIIIEIQNSVPDYDPSERFNWLRAVPVKNNKADNTAIDELRHRMKLLCKLKKFLKQNPEFSIEDRFSIYFNIENKLELERPN